MSQQQEAKIYNEFIIQVVRVVLRCPEDQEIINNSIKNCWQDFYAPKNNGSNRGFVC